MRLFITISQAISIVFGLPLFVVLAAACVHDSLAAPPVQQTRVETDAKTGAILFIVNGRDQARIDATGLHVRKSVEYGGGLTDVGEAGYDSSERLAGSGKP